MSSTLQKKNKEFWIIVINSLAYFMLAYLVIIVLTNSFSILLAHFEGVRGRLYYYGFDVLSESSYWSSELTFLIFFFGIGFSFFLGLIFERLYKRIRRYSMHSKIFYLWGYFLSFTYFFGNLLVGTYFFYGTGVIFQQFSIPWIFRIASGFIAFAALVYLGIYAARGFQISLNSYLLSIERRELRWLLTAQFLYPAIIGNVFIFFLKIPEYNHVNMMDTIVWLTMIIPSISLYISLSSLPSIRFKHKNSGIRILGVPLIVCIIALLIYRVGLMNGLEF